MHNILIVDDDPTQRRLLDSVVGKEGFQTQTVDSGQAALDLLTGIDGEQIDLVLLDVLMPGLDGLEVLARLKPQRPNLPVIVLTAQSGVDIIVKAMQAGAADFIVKPSSPERLRVSIENALRIKGLTGEISRLTRRASGAMTFDDLIYASPIMEELVRLAQRGATSNIPILLEGESGSGKEVIARAVQGSGDRAGCPFVTVNCGAIPENLVESILFGHEKGSFTGADKKHDGKFKEADGGTLFLDEVGELKPDMQVKLLRALQEGEIDPVGAKQPNKVDVRIISATNRNLLNLVRDGNFREDLYYRLNVFPLFVPPLRDRPEDVPPLTHHFVANFAASEGRAIHGVADDVLSLLQRYDWPGNVRQLENAIFRGVVLCEGDILLTDDFPQIASNLGELAVPAHAVVAQAQSGGTTVAVAQAANGCSIGVTDDGGELRKLEEIEHDMIRLAIEQCNGKMSDVARKLGIGRSTLYRKVREMDLQVTRPA